MSEQNACANCRWFVKDRLYYEGACMNGDSEYYDETDAERLNALEVASVEKETDSKPEPLTVEQLREMEKAGVGIYVCRTEDSPIFRDKRYTAAVLDTTWVAGVMKPQLQAIYGRSLTLPEDEYGKTWLAYKANPEGE